MGKATKPLSFERRRHARHPSYIKAELNGQAITILDVSLGGLGGTMDLRGRLERIPAPGEQATIVLHSDGERSVVLTVELVRVDPDRNHFGAQIIEMGDDQFQFLKGLYEDRPAAPPKHDSL